jgi:hypothetical protein
MHRRSVHAQFDQARHASITSSIPDVDALLEHVWRIINTRILAVDSTREPIGSSRRVRDPPGLAITGGRNVLIRRFAPYSPADWRGLSQLVVEPAPEDWCRDYQRLAVQHPLEHERVQRPIASSLPSLAFFALLLGLAAVGLQAYLRLRDGQWLHLFGLTSAACLVLGLALLAIRRLCQPAVYDMDLVREKVTRVAYRAEVRLNVCAPAGIGVHAVKAQLDRVATTYRRYNRGTQAYRCLHGAPASTYGTA